jgi:hypothetical protein
VGVKKDSTPLNNKTALENDRTMDVSKIKTNSDVSDLYPKTHRKLESSNHSSLKNIDGIKTMINNYVIKFLIPQHSRGSSTDKMKIPQPNYNTNGGGKTIHAMKDVIKPHNKENSHTPNYKSTNNNNSNIILNQNGVPCYNNIHIYTSGVSGLKSGDINLRHYIFNKAGKKANLTKQQNKSVAHGRSNSSAGH